MRIFTIVFLSLLFINPASAGINFASQMSHTISGGIGAGIVSAVSDNYWPEYDRAWIGFGVSTAYGIASQYYEYSIGTNTAKEAFVDALSNTIGAAIGAYVTDKYILMPVYKKEPSGSNYVGITAQIRF